MICDLFLGEIYSTDTMCNRIILLLTPPPPFWNALFEGYDEIYWYYIFEQLHYFFSLFTSMFNCTIGLDEISLITINPCSLAQFEEGRVADLRADKQWKISFLAISYSSAAHTMIYISRLSLLSPLETHRPFKSA